MCHTFHKPQDPPTLDVRPYRNIPNGLAREVNGLTMAGPTSPYTFTDARLQTVAMPVMDKTGKPRWADAYYDAFWSLRNGDLRLDEAGDTMYARDTNWLGGDMPNTWHPISSLSEEFDFPTGTHAVRNLEPMFRAEMLKLPRLVRGMRFGNTAFHPQGKHTVVVGEADDNGAYLYVDDSLWLYDSKKTKKIVEQANKFIAQLAADDASRENLLRMFATPFLEPYKHLFYVFYGHGGDGKSFLLGRLGDAYPDKASGISIKALNSISVFESGNEALKLDGRYWAYDEEGDMLTDKDMGIIKRIATGDTIHARSVGRNSVNVRSQATLVIASNHPLATSNGDANMRRLVPVMFSGRKTPQQMQPLADFIDQYGMTPFMLASAMLWADKPLDDDIHRDISFNDSEQELDERAMWIVNEICENGFADTRACPYIGHTSGDTYKMLGVGLRSKRIDGKVCSVRVVIDEDRFAPYRERYEQEVEESRLPLLEDLPVPEIQTDMERRLTEGGEIMNVKAPEGFKLHKEPTDPDNPKAVRNWKNGVQEDVVEIGQGDVYAVIPQPGNIIIDMDAPKDEHSRHGYNILRPMLTPTLMVHTPTHGGIHAYYRLPEGWTGKLKNTNHADDIPVDVKVDGRGYVLGAGSNIEGVGFYRLVGDETEVQEAPLPLLEWLVSHGYGVKPMPKPTSAAKAGAPRNGRPDLAPVPEGRRNDTLYRWAWGRLHNHEDNEANIHDELMLRGHISGLGDTEIERIWKSVKETA
nr:MAG: bifunctional DNA primase/polymerase [Bacteriophage sp.]